MGGDSSYDDLHVSEWTWRGNSDKVVEGKRKVVGGNSPNDQFKSFDRWGDCAFTEE
ncbi:hypothetical protein SK128_021295, partial [Halocaridina rubra]